MEAKREKQRLLGNRMAVGYNLYMQNAVLWILYHCIVFPQLGVSGISPTLSVPDAYWLRRYTGAKEDSPINGIKIICVCETSIRY